MASDPEEPGLFRTVRRPARRGALLAFLAVGFAASSAVFFYGAVIESEGERTRAWWFYGLAFVSLLVVIVLAHFWGGALGGSCGACGRWSLRPWRSVPTFIEDLGSYGMVIRCQHCVGPTVDALEQHLLKSLFSDLEHDAVVQFVRRPELQRVFNLREVPDRSDPQGLRVWIEGFSSQLREATDPNGGRAGR